MPTIDVNKKDLFELLGSDEDKEALADRLAVAKAELKGENDESCTVELTDTNRPDLWSVEGLARAIQTHAGKRFAYDFFEKKPSGEILVAPEMKAIRPYVFGFKASGQIVTEPLLLSLIQSQEKLCENFGNKREQVAIGVYRGEEIQFPVSYRAGLPDVDGFAPLGMGHRLTLREILSQHPKGQAYGHLLESQPAFPLLEDSVGEVLSMPPIINSNTLGAVRVGETHLFVEMTGWNVDNLLLCATLLATGLADRGWKISPVTSIYPYDTARGREVVCPADMGIEMELDETDLHSCLGITFAPGEVEDLLARMGHKVVKTLENPSGRAWLVRTPCYRDDVMHSVDLIEDVAISRGYASFDPVMPEEFTVGRLSPEEGLADAVRSLLVGAGCQEIMGNILTSGEALLAKMNRTEAPIVEIDNVMTLQFAMLRDTLLPGLLNVEASSQGAPYPHRMFEVGEVARVEEGTLSGTRTLVSMSCVIAHAEACVSEIQSLFDAINNLMGLGLTIEPLRHPSFIEGRCASILKEGHAIGLLGEIHPQVLDNWGIMVPASAMEIHLSMLL